MTFSADLSKFVQKAKGNVDQAVRDITVEVAQRLVERTPVESGTARGNWTASIGGFTAAATGNPDKDGADTVAHITEAVAGAKAGDVVFITNTLPYIRELEHGSSKQAPAGMVSVTVAEFTAIADQAARKAGGS